MRCLERCLSWRANARLSGNVRDDIVKVVASIFRPDLGRTHVHVGARLDITCGLVRHAGCAWSSFHRSRCDFKIAYERLWEGVTLSLVNLR